MLDSEGVGVYMFFVFFYSDLPSPLTVLKHFSWLIIFTKLFDFSSTKILLIQCASCANCTCTINCGSVAVGCYNCMCLTLSAN